jgi:subtilase family serine protease
MFGWNRRKKEIPQVMFETLEPRELFSTTAVSGYTPAQIRHAYGFDQVNFDKGSVAADGSGQTIAIVDAYNDPNLFGDVQVFDSQFSLPSINLSVVNQTGGSKLPTTDAGWATEISLDVEWAHAIAPGAKVLLVEASSSSVSDLMAAVDYARDAAGVSVVSMSWGGSEFFSWNGGESSSQTSYDPFFTTPGGHQGVTFIAAAGDSGASNGVQWPSSSPNVISVGGTTLNLDSNGNYVSESSWSGTSGGYSQVESEPSYQLNVQSTGVRSTPDVSYDGDPNTGFAVYDSLAYQGSSGWQVYGGTSAGAPQWAALVAIADQGRTLAGEGTLDGASQTLPMLYALYNSSSTYAAGFNDVVDTSSPGRWHWRWGGFGNGNSATSGYDTATGLGTPKAAGVVAALVADAAVTSTGGSTSSGSGGTTSGSGGSTSSGGTTSSGSGTTTQTLAASPFDVNFMQYSSSPATAGDSGSARLMLNNTSNNKYTGPVQIDLYASADSTLSSADTLIGTVTLSRVSLAPRGSRTVRVKYTLPADLSGGNYFLIATADASADANTADATVATPTAISVAAQHMDLAATFAASQAIAVTPGHRRAVAITLTNLGNVTAIGTIALNLYASSGTMLGAASQQLLASVPARKIKLKAGKSITLLVAFTAPAQAAGSYNLIASINPSTQLADSNAANNLAAIGTRAA